MSDWVTPLIRFLIPLRPVLISLVALIGLMLGCVAAGLYVTFTLNHPSDKTVLILLAGMVYPGPYFFYGLFGVFLFHARKSPVLSATYNLGTTLLTGLALFINMREVEGDTLAAQLHQTLFESFIAAAAAGTLLIGLLLLQARNAKPRLSS